MDLERVPEVTADYFNYLQILYKTYIKILRECQLDTLKIYNLLERKHRIQRANITNTPLIGFKNIKDKLDYFLIDEINSIMPCINKGKSKMHKMANLLKHKYEVLEQLLESRMPRSSQGSPYQPRFSEILQYSRDGARFALQVCAQVENAVFHLVKNQKVNKTLLYNSFKIDKSTQHRMNTIFMVMQFISL
ncbi:uncharacterized protein LOC143914305 [Arctopsyche grandis]|uniref:uncharacterized protein LOC143914305 n=1 Tax=Arctopsyche grandis TaxID=121162 RepID=UPI00406D9D19